MSDAAGDQARKAAERAGGRVPPHNLDAEASLLGAMLLSRDAIATAVEVVSADNFYKPAHARVFEAVVSLYGAGEPVDPVTVAEELRRAGLLDAVGGPAFLVGLQASTPAISSAARYARIVEEHALLRRLIGVAGEIAEMAYEMPDDVTKAVDHAESLMFGVAEKRVTDSMAPLKDLLDANLDRLEELYERGDAITGLPSGYTDLDELLSGLQPSQLVVVGARPSMGKCVAWDTPVLDPSTGALVTIAEVVRRGSAGEEVRVASLAPDGLTVRVPSAFVDDGVKPVFRVRTASGREVRTTATHPFLTERGWRPLRDIGVGTRVAVPRVLPWFGHDERHPVEVVLLAHLVGHADTSDGQVCFNNPSPSVRADLLRHGGAADAQPVGDGRAAYRVVPGRHGDVVHQVARRHGLLGSGPAERRLPDAVFRLPRAQLALFCNRLFAVSGGARAAARGCGRVYLTSPSAGVARGVAHLLARFGVEAVVHRRRVCVHGGDVVSWDVDVVDPESIVRFCVEVGIHGRDADLAVLARRAVGARHPVQAVLGPVPGARGTRDEPGGQRGGPDQRSGPGAAAVLERAPLGRRALAALRWDEVVEVTPDGSDQVYDLTVPGTHNFVAGDVFVHNTAFALGMASAAALESRRPVLFFSLEMGHLEITQRLLCAEARVPSERLRNGRLMESDWPKISHAVGRLAEATLWVDDNPHLTVMEIRAKARRLKSRVGDLGLVVIDYLQLMTGRGAAENRQVEVSEISRGLKILARELQTPVVALSQLSRALEMRADKRPMLADLRESGCLTAGTRIALADGSGTVEIGDLARRGERDLCVWTLDDRLRLVPATMTHAFSSGVKAVFEVRLASGRRLRASANHPLRVPGGWSRVDELEPGGRVAVAARAPSRVPRRAGTRAGATRTGASATAVALSEEPVAPVVMWDRVSAVVPAGHEEVFDATVPGTHNFVADGVVVHNSIEQDADVVMFIYRDEVYNTETADTGVAEVHVAKHRNGPTGTVRLAFLGHYTRFANMARGV